MSGIHPALETRIRRDLARQALRLFVRRGVPFPGEALELQAQLLRLEPHWLIEAAWGLVEDGSLTYDARGVFTPKAAT